MKVYRVIRQTKVFSEPNLTLQPVGTLDEGQEIHGDPEPGFTAFIKTSLPNLSDEAVFVFKSHLEDADPPSPEPILETELGAFCGEVTWAAREYRVDRDYLLTVAYCLSNNLTEFGTATSPEIGPFKFGADQWAAAITEGPAKDLGVTARDRYRWYKQPAVAALLIAECQKELETALGRKPTRSELFFAQLFGSGANAMLNGDRSQQISSTPLAGTYAAELKATMHTVDAALIELKTRLNRGPAYHRVSASLRRR